MHEDIKYRLAELMAQVGQLHNEQVEIKKTLAEVRDRVISTPACPSPGLCVMLQQQGADREARLRALERRDAIVVGACLILSIGMPILLRVFFKI